MVNLQYLEKQRANTKVTWCYCKRDPLPAGAQENIRNSFRPTTPNVSSEKLLVFPRSVTCDHRLHRARCRRCAPQLAAIPFMHSQHVYGRKGFCWRRKRTTLRWRKKKPRVFSTLLYSGHLQRSAIVFHHLNGFPCLVYPNGRAQSAKRLLAQNTVQRTPAVCRPWFAG